MRPIKTRCRPAAPWRSTATDFPPPSRRRWTSHPLITLERGEVALAARRLGQRHHRDRPSHLARSCRAPSATLTGEEQLAFFDAIAPIVHRDSIDLDQAWFQSRYDKAGPGGSGADYINCPLTREQYDVFVDALTRRRQSLVSRLGSLHALFRRLPADRGDGRARPRNLAPRADEAVRPDQSACAGREALRGGAAAPGQQARHACSTWSAFRPS